MKKIFLIIAVSVTAVFFSSCGDNFAQDVFDLVSGKASITTGDGNSDAFPSSIAMFDNDASTPYVLGMSMEIDINQLISTGSVEEVDYPFMCYRLVGDDIQSGTTLTVNNVLTNDDLDNFDYRSLLNGEFANNQVIGYAFSPTIFYVMNTGSIHLTKVNKHKVVGSFEGTAYVINTDATPMLSENLVNISGSFKSRVIPMMRWLLDLQAQTDETKF